MLSETRGKAVTHGLNSFPTDLLGKGGNFVLFHLLWGAAIFGAVAGTNLWAALTLGIMIVQGLTVTRRWRVDALLIASGTLVGVVFEILLLQTGAIEYALQEVSWFPPFWIIALWIGFAQSFNHSLNWLTKYYLFAALLGGIGSVASVFSGIHFGAAQTSNPLLLGLVYAIGWGMLIPFFAWITNRLNVRFSTDDDVVSKEVLENHE